MKLLAGLYNRRVRGFRVINFACIILLLVMMFGLYWAKTRASGDSAAVAEIDRQIVAEKRDIRLLEAQVAGLEQPQRIGRLSQDYLHLAPATAAQELTPDRLAVLAHGGRPAVAPPPAPVAPAPAVAAAAPQTSLASR